MADLNTLIEELGSLNVMDAVKLVKQLEEKWGVSATPTAVEQVPGMGGPGAPVVEAKTEFDVVLTSFPPEKKINVIKEVRAITGLGLKESKDLVESAPKALKEAVTQQEAAAIKKQLEDAGATVEVK